MNIIFSRSPAHNRNPFQILEPISSLILTKQSCNYLLAVLHFSILLYSLPQQTEIVHDYDIVGSRFFLIALRTPCLCKSES